MIKYEGDYMENQTLAEVAQSAQSSIERSKKIKIRPLSKQNIVIHLTVFSLAFLTIFGFLVFDYGNIGVAEGFKAALVNFKTMLTEPALSSITFSEAIYAVLVTFGLGILTTLFGAVIALFFGLFAAKNLTNPFVSNFIKGIVAFIRAVPTVLWVLIFSIAAGLGAEAAVIGMTFHTVGYLIKVYSETFEGMDQGGIEALKSSGANWWQIVFQSVLPTTMTALIAWTFLRFEINFSVAVAMGAAAGAGGIGFDLFMASGFYYDIREIGAITYFILAIAIILEFISTRVRTKMLTSH